jgi:sialidase-1
MRRWRTMNRIAVGAMFIILSIVLVTQLHATPTQGLVLHLSFDKATVQGDSITDLSPLENDAIIHGNAELAEGKFGDAMLFDGVDDYVEVPLSDSITFTEGSTFTAQVWVKTDDSPTQNDGILGNYKQGTDALWMLSVSGDDANLRGKMGFSVRDVGRANSASVRSPDFLNDNEWHHLAGVRDQATKKVRFYVDGTLIDEVDDETGDINSTQSVWIGEHLSRFYKGLIDDVKLWDRALSAADINRSMEGAAAVDPESKTATLWGSLKNSY